MIERALSRPQRTIVVNAPSSSPAGKTLRQAEVEEIRAALDKHGSVESAATVLGLSRSALYQKMRKHGLRRS
ncbi:MAG: hypothetical protein JNK82_15205 [Myxococcaceae bacterium]|nr:hypothetical protein [Myxococcaceae bacterium]